MAQHEVAHTVRRSIAGALTLAGALAMGCGGSADAEPAANDADERSGATPQQPAGDEVSAAQPAGAVTLPSVGVHPAPPNGAPELPEPELPPDPEPAVTTVQLTSDTVRVASSGGGVDATVFLARSPEGTTLTLAEAGDRICVIGEVLPLPGTDYARYWGGEVGLILSSSSPPTDAAAGAGLAAPGFAFRLQGALPPQLRFRAGAAGEDPLTSQYCQQVAQNVGSSIEISLGALTSECWLEGGAPYPSAASATLVSWQIPAVESGGTFDFCIEDIRALP